MKKLNNDIKTHRFEAVYLLYGNEDYLKHSYKNRLTAAIAGEGGMNLKELEGRDLNLSELKDFTDTLPFFADKRLLVLRDTGLFKSASEHYDEWLTNLPDTACVIFVESECDKRNRLFKLVSEHGYAAELNHPDEEMLGRWIQTIVRNNRLNITKDAYSRILECLDEDMERSRSEMDKLCAYCSDKGTITREDVDAILTPVITGRIFEMTENIARFRQQKALDLYYDLLSLKEPPMRILYLITRQFNQMLLVKEMTAERKSRNEIADALKIRPFAAGKLAELSARFSVAELNQAVARAAELEEAVKTGNLQDTLAAELLLISLSGHNNDGQRSRL